MQTWLCFNAVVALWHPWNNQGNMFKTFPVFKNVSYFIPYTVEAVAFDLGLLYKRDGNTVGAQPKLEPFLKNYDFNHEKYMYCLKLVVHVLYV